MVRETSIGEGGMSVMVQLLLFMFLKCLNNEPFSQAQESLKVACNLWNNEPFSGEAKSAEEIV